MRDDYGDIIGYLLIGTDNSVRKQVELELNNAMAVAEKANLAKSDFLSSMSHELRTPLSAILGFAQLMESGSPAPTVSQKRSIDQILQAGWYLLELINEILDLALIESGKLSLSLESISLAEVIQECQAMIGPQAQKRGIGVHFATFATPYFVKADRTRVKQVLINLLSNAIKYNKAGGAVDVQFVTSTPGRIRICVEDTGEGLTQEKLAQLFQPFNRLGQEANVEEGTGIGLVVAKRLIEWMGGAIGVESVVGKGSVFWIEMNLTDEPQITAASAGTHWRWPNLPIQCRRTAAHAALRRGQPRQPDAGRGSDRAPARYPPAERAGRHQRRRHRARFPAGRHPDGHQSARHQWHRGAANPAPTIRRRRTFPSSP